VGEALDVVEQDLDQQPSRQLLNNIHDRCDGEFRLLHLDLKQRPRFAKSGQQHPLGVSPALRVFRLLMESADCLVEQPHRLQQGCLVDHHVVSPPFSLTFSKPTDLEVQ
jgi:hypothetical protein